MTNRIDLINYLYSKWNRLNEDIKIKRYRNSFERFLCEQPLDEMSKQHKECE